MTKPFNTAVCLFSGLMLFYAAPAWAGNSAVTSPTPTDTCKTDKGSLCPPKGVTEEVVPEYYNVPTTTKHIYYKKPVVKPIVTHIIHHVPTPVYGGEVRTETVQAGHWHGAPVARCCQQTQQPARPVYHAAPQRPVHAAPPRPVYRPSPCQARQYPHTQPRVQSRPCR